jgi:hypothetical protein
MERNLSIKAKRKYENKRSETQKLASALIGCYVWFCRRHESRREEQFQFSIPMSKQTLIFTFSIFARFHYKIKLSNFGFLISIFKNNFLFQLVKALVSNVQKMV